MMPTECEVAEGAPVISSGDRIVLVLSAAIVLGLLGTLAVSIERAETRRNDFFAKCIEFQTWDRCDTLYRYGRQDLMERR